MDFFKGLFGKSSSAKNETTEIRSRYSSLSSESFLVKLRTTTASEPLSRSIQQGISTEADDLFNQLPDLRKPWQSICSSFLSRQSMRASRSAPDELLRRLEFFEQVYEAIESLGKNVISFASNFLHVLVFTLEDLTPDLLTEHTSKIVELLQLIQVVVSEDDGPLLLNEDFGAIFGKFVRVTVQQIISFSRENERESLQLLLSTLQTNFVLSELYAAHLQYKPDIKRMLLQVLDNYREVIKNHLLLADLLRRRVGPVLNSGLLRSASMNLCLRFKEVDVTLQVLVQLSHLSKFIIDEANTSSFKHLLFEFLVNIVISQFTTMEDDDPGRYIMIHKAATLTKMFMNCVEMADVVRYTLICSIKDLYYNTSLTYCKGRQSHGCESFTTDKNTLAYFFLYLSGICNKLLGYDELEINIVLMLHQLTLSDMLQAGAGLPPVIQAYSLELLDRYLDAIINEKLSIEWIVRGGACEVLLNRSLFVMEESEDQRTLEVANIVSNYIYKIFCRLASVSSSLTSCMSSWHISISSHLNDISYISNCLTLLSNLCQTPEGLAAISESETFRLLLDLLDQQLFVQNEVSMDLQCVDKVLQMLNMLLRMPGLEIAAVKLHRDPHIPEEIRHCSTSLPQLFGKMMRSPVYFPLACDYLTEGFRINQLNASMSDQFLSALRDQSNPSFIKDMLKSVERILQYCSKKDERELIQSSLIKRIPAAVIKKINDTKDLGLCTSLLSLLRSLFSSSKRSSQLDVIEMLFKSIKDIIKKRASSDSEFRDLIFNLLMILFETTQLEDSCKEVQNPKLIPYIINMLRVCANNDIVVEYLQKLKGDLKQSLYNLSVFNSYHTIDKLLKLFKRPALQSHALDLVEIIGAYYIKPSSLKIYLEILNDRLQRGSMRECQELISRLLHMSSSSASSACKLVGPSFAYTRSLPKLSFHFKSPDSYIRVTENGSIFENDSCSFVMWLHPVKPGSLFSLVTANPKPQLLVLINPSRQLCFRYSPVSTSSEWDLPLVVDLNFGKWNFLALTFFKNTVTVVLNNNAPKTETLSTNIANEFRSAREFSLNFGNMKVSSYDFIQSFQGDLALFYVIPGVKVLPYSDIYSLGFDLSIDSMLFETRDTSHIDEPQSSRLRELSKHVTLKLHADAMNDTPKALSLRGSRLKNPDFAAFITPTTKTETLSVMSSKVNICSGHNLLEAFQALGGLQLIIGLLRRIRESDAASLELVEQVVETFKNLGKVKSLLTYSEIAEQNLLDMLCFELKCLAAQGLVSDNVLRSIIEFANTPWLYKVPDNVKTVCDPRIAAVMLQTHPIFILLTDFKTWRCLEQSNFFNRVSEAINSIQLMLNVPEEPSKLSVLQVYYLNYFLKLARKNPIALTVLRDITPNFIVKLKLRQRLFSILQLIEQEIKVGQNFDALQLLLDVAGSFEVADYQDLVVVRFPMVQEILQLTVETISKRCVDTEQASDILKSCADIISKLLDIRTVRTLNLVQKPEELSICSSLKGVVFTAAEGLRKADMLVLLHKFFKSSRDIDPRFDFKMTLCLIYKQSPVLTVSSPYEISILSDIILDQFMQLHEFGEAYECLYNFSKYYLKDCNSVVSYDYLCRLLEQILTLKPLNGFQLTFAVYFAEDISRFAEKPLNIGLLELLYKVLNASPAAYNNDPKIPDIKNWDIIDEIPRERSTNFKRREGGFVRILLKLLLRTFVSSRDADDRLRVLKLLREYLQIRTEKFSLTFSSLESMNSLQNIVNFQQFQGEMNLLNSEVNLLGFVFGELSEALRLHPELQSVQAFMLMIDCLLTKDKNLDNFVSFYKKRSDSYRVYLQRNYKQLKATCLWDQASGREDHDIDMETGFDFEKYEMENSLLIGLEDHLDRCRRASVFDSLFEPYNSQIYPLSKLIDYALSLTSMKMKLVEDSLDLQVFGFDVSGRLGSGYRSPPRRRGGDRSVESLIVREISHADNLRKLGKVKHKALIKALTRPFEILQALQLPRKSQSRSGRLLAVNSKASARQASSPLYLRVLRQLDSAISSITRRCPLSEGLIPDFELTAKPIFLRQLNPIVALPKSEETNFWKLSQVADAQGRRLRLEPFHRGSSYHDKVNKKYLRGMSLETCEIDINSIVSSIGSSAETSSYGIQAIPDNLASVEWKVKGETAWKLAQGFESKRAVLECERISVARSIYGIIEISPTLVIFRSTEQPRPTGIRYEVSTPGYSHKQRRSLKVWKMSEIEEILPKYFMHTHCALEIYCKDGRSYLFNLFQDEVLINLREMLSSGNDYVKVYTDNGREGIMEWTKRWKQREISNYEYLIKLNRYSSRSFNNLNQYPVFPWILKDYTKRRPIFDEQDYRDLGRPVGCLSEDKLTEATSRYDSFDSDIGMGPYHYGCHYSVGGIVMYYLIRLEPFSAQHIEFQENHFDDADRLFFSIRTSWHGSYAASGDFKELVPELFSLPEMLLNLHHYNLGKRQSGEYVDNVILPNWAMHSPATADMDPHRFIFFHRQALESTVVSQRLHKWINLIFGTYQESKAKHNVFFPITYAHHFTQQLANSDMPRGSLLEQVTHFGQVPVRLFDRKHDKRRLEQADLKDRNLFLEFDCKSISETRASYKDERRNVKGKAAAGKALNSPVVVSIQLRRELSCVIFDSEGRYYAHFFDVNRPDMFKLLESYTSKDTCELDLVKVNFPLEAVNSEWFAFSESKVLVSGRHPDHSFRFHVVLTKPFRVFTKLQVLHHCDVISCLDLAEDSLLATGALDGSLSLWEVDLRNSDLGCKLRVSLRGHSSAITQITINAALQLVASLSFVSSIQSGLILLHDVNTGCLFNNIVAAPNYIPRCIALSKHGLLAVGLASESARVVLHSINSAVYGRPLEEIHFSAYQGYNEVKANSSISKDELKCLKFSSEGDFLITGGDGTFGIVPVYDKEIVPYFYGAKVLVRVIAVDPDERRVIACPQMQSFLQFMKFTSLQRKLKAEIISYT